MEGAFSRVKLIQRWSMFALLAKMKKLDDWYIGIFGEQEPHSQSTHEEAKDVLKGLDSSARARRGQEMFY